jgi:hypothetical protein
MSLKWNLSCSWAVLFTSADKMLNVGIFVVLMLLGVHNLITQMLDYQQENKTTVK